MVKCSIPTTLIMTYFSVSEDLLFYACPLRLSERKTSNGTEVIPKEFAQTQAMEMLTIMNIVNRKESEPSLNTQPGTVKRLKEILPLTSTSILKLFGVWEGEWGKEYSVPRAIIPRRTMLSSWSKAALNVTLTAIENAS